MKINLLLDRDVNELSGGELQKVAIAACLSRTADLYLLDEPSAYLDVEERLNMARAIRRVVENHNVTAFVVEHDVLTQDFISDRLMVFAGIPGRDGQANPHEPSQRYEPLPERNASDIQKRPRYQTAQSEQGRLKTRQVPERSRRILLRSHIGEIGGQSAPWN